MSLITLLLFLFSPTFRLNHKVCDAEFWKKLSSNVSMLENVSYVYFKFYVFLYYVGYLAYIS